MATCPYPGCEKGCDGDGCCGAHSRWLRMHNRGFVSLPDAGLEYGVDRRVLKVLYEAGEILGMEDGGRFWLRCDSLSVYAARLPRCIVDGCNRRVFGQGPGCGKHRRNGRARPAVVREQISAAQKGKQTVAREAGELLLTDVSAKTGISIERLREGTEPSTSGVLPKLTVKRWAARPGHRPVPVFDQGVYAELKSCRCSEPGCDTPAPAHSGGCAEHAIHQGHQDWREKMREEFESSDLLRPADVAALGPSVSTETVLYWIRKGTRDGKLPVAAGGPATNGAPRLTSAHGYPGYAIDKRTAKQFLHNHFNPRADNHGDGRRWRWQDLEFRVDYAIARGAAADYPGLPDAEVRWLLRAKFEKELARLEDVLRGRPAGSRKTAERDAEWLDAYKQLVEMREAMEFAGHDREADLAAEWEEVRSDRAIFRTMAREALGPEATPDELTSLAGRIRTAVLRAQTPA